MKNDAAKILPLNEFLSLFDSASNRLTIRTEAMIGLQFDGFEIEADEFMKFAEADLQQETTQGLVNALSNAKRAIDCQVDTVLGCFGLLARHSFPQKINILNELGIVTPRIIKKVVKARNFLEHEYINPEREQVEDAVDVATLFVISLDKGLRNFWCDFVILEATDAIDEADAQSFYQEIDVHYDDEKIQFELWGGIYDASLSEKIKIRIVTSAIITPKDKGFTELVKLSFALDSSILENDLNDQINKLFQILRS